MTDNKYTVKLGEILADFPMEVVYAPEGYEDILLSTADVSRPGLQLSSQYFRHFDNGRIQVCGNVEHSYLESQSHEERFEALYKLCNYHIPAIIVTRELPIFEEMVEACKLTGVPLLRTPLNTSSFMSAIIAALTIALGPRITRHGVLVEVYGEGMLILGESGVGKSETAIELVKRGHRLVADDAVEIKRTSSKTLVGTSPAVIRHFIELRGIGIVDVKEIFGMGAIKQAEKIDLVVNIEPWQQGKAYDRLGMEEQYTEILGIKIPSLTIPVKPGRNLAIILEVAAMNNRQKKMGYNAAEALNERLMKQMEERMK